MQAHLRILDTDDSVNADALTSVAPWASVTRVDLRDLGPALRLWSRRKNIDRARASLQRMLRVRRSRFWARVTSITSRRC